MQPQHSAVSKSWYFATSARLGQKLLKDKLEISLSLQNPHSRTMRHLTESTTPTYLMNQSWESVSRSIRLAVSYRFGKQGVAVKRAKRKYDDTTEEVGGGSSNQGGR